MVNKRYGIPYMGSKNSIANWVVELLPAAETFVDLFAGGCAITHAAMMSGKWWRLIANDITDAPSLFSGAIHGEYRNEKRWISREAFFAEKNTDPYIRLCWSFGNCGMTYMYGKDIEEYKRALHYAIFFDDFAPMRDHSTLARFADRFENAVNGIDDIHERYMEWRKIANDNKDSLQSLQSLKSLESLESLKRLQSLQSLEKLQSLLSLERLQSLRISQNDYRKVRIPKNATVYCDIPYRGTGKYQENGKAQSFDHEAFYEWALTREFPVYVSEYSMPEGFVCVETKYRCGRMGADSCTKECERLFVQARFANPHKSGLLFIV